MSTQLNHSQRKQKSSIPTIKGALIFSFKAVLLQILRGIRNVLSNEFKRFPINNALSGTTIISESVLPLRTAVSHAENPLLLGKIHNLRLAIRQLNGVEVPAGRVFSFWAQIGRTSHWKGYVKGRELREGCIIPAIGGGICQLSNMLYGAALQAGFEIIERHAHTQVVPGSLAETGKDATVFWNYIDLRFKALYNFRIEATMDADSLTVSIRGNVAKSPERVATPQNPNDMIVSISGPQSCVACGMEDCFKHVKKNKKMGSSGRTAYLADEFWPEFDKYICDIKQEQDVLFIPVDGSRFGKTNYAWSTKPFEHVKQSRKATLLRALKSRKLSTQGAARQRALLTFHETLADSYASMLPYDVTHVVVMQNLLPFLWHKGHLDGRTFDVMMTSLPFDALHERLDLASSWHPESKTLADFRADKKLIEVENKALEEANRIITPHSEIAKLYKDKMVKLDWAIPPQKSLHAAADHRYTKIIFPASTVGRKGAYELRAAIQGLDLQLIVIGKELEGDNFWQGFPVEHRNSNENWLDGASAVVLPAYIENKPRRLLESVACGAPVIASTACGLENMKEVISIPFGDINVLRHEIEKIIFTSLCELA